MGKDDIKWLREKLFTSIMREKINSHTCKSSIRNTDVCMYVCLLINPYTYAYIRAILVSSFRLWFEQHLSIWATTYDLYLRWKANRNAKELTSPLGGFLGNFLMPFAAVSAWAPGAGVVTFFAGAGFDILQVGSERDRGRGSAGNEEKAERESQSVAISRNQSQFQPYQIF